MLLFNKYKYPIELFPNVLDCSTDDKSYYKNNISLKTLILYYFNKSNLDSQTTNLYNFIDFHIMNKLLYNPINLTTWNNYQNVTRLGDESYIPGLYNNTNKTKYNRTLPIPFNEHIKVIIQSLYNNRIISTKYNDPQDTYNDTVFYYNELDASSDYNTSYYDRIRICKYIYDKWEDRQKFNFPDLKAQDYFDINDIENHINNHCLK